MRGSGGIGWRGGGQGAGPLILLSVRDMLCSLLQGDA